MSLTPRAPSHQSPAPRTRQQGKALLLPIESKPTTSSALSTLSTKNNSNSSPVVTKPSTSFSRPINNRVSSSNATRRLVPISSELSLNDNNKPQGGGSLVPISNTNRETGIVQLERSRSKHDGRGGIVLPQDDANISIDKLLAQWEDKINKAENEFEEEELAFERAKDRLSAAPNRPSLRSLSPNASTRLLEKAKRIIASHNQNDNTRLPPTKRHINHCKQRGP